jgi:hypothetical protein
MYVRARKLNKERKSVEGKGCDLYVSGLFWTCMRLRIDLSVPSEYLVSSLYQDMSPV